MQGKSWTEPETCDKATHKEGQAQYVRGEVLQGVVVVNPVCVVEERMGKSGIQIRNLGSRSSCCTTWDPGCTTTDACMSGQGKQEGEGIRECQQRRKKGPATERERDQLGRATCHGKWQGDSLREKKKNGIVR